MMKLRYTPLNVAITLILTGTIHSTVLAQTSPPQPAINACNSLSEGSNCSFQMPNGTISGSCGVIENKLACMLANSRGPQSQPTSDTQPPPNNETGGIQPPPNNETAGTQPPPNNETGGIQPPPNNETAGTQPPPNNETGGTQSPPNNETGGTQPPPNGSSNGPQPRDDGPQTNTIPQFDYAYFDFGNNTLYLPEINAGVLGNYYLTLSLTGFEPLTFDLNNDSISPITPTAQPDAVYEPDSGALSIPTVQVGTDWYNDVQMTQLPVSDVYRFELTSMTVEQAPSDSDGTGDDTTTSGDNTGSDGGTTSTSGVHPISDTNQSVLYDDSGNLVDSIQSGDAFFGQDANYIGTPFNYTDNNDGTVTDANTGLLWEQAHHATQLSFYDAKSVCEGLELGGHTSWRLPNLKELFSLADFKGNQHTGRYYLDNDYLDLAPPEAVDDDDQFSSHTVQMMGQTWSSIIYTGDHWNDPNREAAFFFNFLDGHIKQAPTSGTENFYRCVYGDEYGANDFVINGDGTVTDQNSGLIWQQQDDGIGRNWQDSLAYCEGFELAGQTDWRLPNIKELQSIVDYTRHDPAIDPAAFTLTDSEGWFWSGTTHGDSTLSAAYICFGKCDSKDDVDTHGAGAQRADPKSGEPADYSEFGGAQDDDVRIDNYSRCVRGGVAEVSFVTTDPDSVGNNNSSGDVAGPPQEAIDACSGLTENASCSIQAGDQTISGSCSDLQGTLACKPN